MDRTVSFPEHNPKAVESLVKFFYTGAYEDPPMEDGALDYGDWVRAPWEVYKLADYVMSSELKELTLRPIARWLEAVLHAKSRENLWKTNIPNLAREVYDSTNSESGHSGLRMTVVEACRDCIKAGCGWEALEPLMKEYVEFAVDIFRCMEEMGMGQDKKAGVK